MDTVSVYVNTAGAPVSLLFARVPAVGEHIAGPGGWYVVTWVGFTESGPAPTSLIHVQGPQAALANPPAAIPAAASPFTLQG